jgi:Outer membrane protein beta-barrel domain
MRHAIIVILTATALTAVGTPASAQDWKGFLSANAGYQVSGTEFSDNVTFTAFAEQSDFDITYKAPAGPIFDVSGVARVWRNLGIGAAVSSYRKESPATIDARIPYPFDFNQFREVSGDTGSLKREELAVHVQALWMIPIANRIDVAVFGGPSFFQVTQPFVDSLQYDYTYPFDTATLTGTNTTPQKENSVGFNGGVDVMYMLTKSVGIGGVLRYSQAQVEFTSADDQTFKIDVGGPQAGVGVRFRF